MVVSQGTYVEVSRPSAMTTYIDDRITSAGSGENEWPVEPGRYHLVVARGCAGANQGSSSEALCTGGCHVDGDLRADPRRRQLGPSDSRPSLTGRTQVSASCVLKDRLRGAGSRGTHGGSPCRPSSRPRAGRSSPTTSRSSPSTSSRPSGASTTGTAHPTCTRKALREEIDTVNKRVYTEVNNGVYRCGFAGTQGAYDPLLRPALHRAGLAGGAARETQRYPSWATRSPRRTRLFTTLARFDPVYHGHFKCNWTKLTRRSWAYAPRPVPEAPGFGRHDRLRAHQELLL